MPFSGDAVRRAREGYGMSITVLARRVGVSTRAISEIENGHTQNPRINTVWAIADTLHMSLDALVGRQIPQREEGTDDD